MDSHPSSKSLNTLASMCKKPGSTPTTQEDGCSTPIRTANAERKVTVIKVTGPATRIIPDRSTLTLLRFFLQELIHDNNRLGIFLALYAEILSFVVGTYASVPKELRILCEEIVNLINKFFPLSMDASCWSNIWRHWNVVGSTNASFRLSISVNVSLTGRASSHAYRL